MQATLFAALPDSATLHSERKEDLVRKIIADLAAHGVTAEELGGGLTNMNFRLDWGGSVYVLRIAPPGTELLGIDRATEAACSRAAAEAGVGPEFLLHLPERSALVSRFVPGRSLSEEALRMPEVLARVAATVRRCHGHPVPTGLAAFRPFEIIRTYVTLARERSVPMPPDLEQSLACLAQIESIIKTLGHVPDVLCHNDLLAANFLDAGDRLIIIDWEYGGAGDRYFDLGNFAVNAGLTEAQEVEFLTHYLGTPPTGDQVQRLRLMRLVSDLREATWSFLQAGLSKLGTPEEYLARGKDHLKRFLDTAQGLGLGPTLLQ